MKFHLKDNIKKIRREFTIAHFIAGLILGLVVIFIAFICILAWGIYKLGWEGKIIDDLATSLHLPVARVNSQFILYPDYLVSLKSADKFYEKQRQANFPDVPTYNDLKKIVLEERLINNILVKKIARRYNITVNQEEVNNHIDEVIKSKGSKEELEKFLADYYNLNIEQYKKYFTEPNLYLDKLEIAVRDDKHINGQAKSKIEEALAKLKNGDKFEDIAKQYSEGAEAAQGGLIGNVLRGELPKEIENNLFGMEAGQYSDIYNLADRFIIFRLEKKDEARGVLTLSSIEVKFTTLSDLITEEKQKTQIKIYVY